VFAVTRCALNSALCCFQYSRGQPNNSTVRWTLDNDASGVAVAVRLGISLRVHRPSGLVYCESEWGPCTFRRISPSVDRFLADRTATQYDRLLAAACCPSVCPTPSVCDAVHSGSQGWCTGLKVVPTCS